MNKEKETKGIQTRNKKIKMSVFANDSAVYIDVPHQKKTKQNKKLKKKTSQIS